MELSMTPGYSGADMWIARRIAVALVTGLFLVSISSHLTWAALGSGRLDPAFGVRGKVLTPAGGAQALAIQSDGKIVATGGGILARYNSRGRLDRQFGAQGKVTDSCCVQALAIQSDGKIVTAGYNVGDFALARYNPDGSLDATFNATGKVLTDFSGSGSVDKAFALAIQSDAKIVAAGHSAAGGTADFALARYFP